MDKFEYRVVPAPAKANKVRGVKGGSAKFAHTIEELMNELGAEGWEYLRADTLPAEERVGLTSKQTVFQNMLVFRRRLSAPASLPAPEPVAELPPPMVEPARKAVSKVLPAFFEKRRALPVEADSDGDIHVDDVIEAIDASVEQGPPQRTVPRRVVRQAASDQTAANTPRPEEQAEPRHRSDRPSLNPALAARAARLRASKTAAE